jgi:hypothetical protein
VNKYEITIDGTKFIVSVGDVSASPVQVIVNGEQKTVAFREAVAAAPALVAPATAPASTPAVAPTPCPSVVRHREPCKRFRPKLVQPLPLAILW